MELPAQLKNERGDVFFELSYRPGPNYLYAEWIGYAVHRNVIEGGQMQMDWTRLHARDRGTQVVVNDTRRMRGSWESAVDWSIEVASPALAAAGLRLNAVILSPDLFTQVSAEAMVDGATALPMRIFPSLAEAEHWIAGMHAAA